MIRNPALCFFLALALPGCTKAVTITSPLPPTVAPITALTVRFSSFVDPGTFIAELDGVNVTNRFVPAAAPNGTSTMQMGEEPFRGGTWIKTSSAPPPFLSVGVEAGGSGGTPGKASVPINVPTGSGSGGKPAPNIAMFFHTLHVSARCNGMICDTTDEVDFIPIHLVGIPGTLNVKVGEHAIASVETFPAMTTPLQNVHVRPSSVSVSLDTLLPGVLLSLTIPQGGSPQFRVTGSTEGNLVLFLEARGTQTGGISGLVNR